MASNVSTVDGMGFEEVNQSSYTEMISGNNLYGNNAWVQYAQVEDYSGATMRVGVYNGDTVDVAAVIGDDVFTTNGELQSTSIQNATELFGYHVKAGSVLMDAAGYSGLISFVDAGSFSTANYFITISARDWTLPQANTAGSLTSFGISGTRRASGCWAYGPSGTVADWIAVGI